LTGRTRKGVSFSPAAAG